MATDPVISVRISDIVEIYNTLVSEREIQWIAKDNDDLFFEPLSMLIQELGGKPLEFSKEGKVMDNLLNLRIKCRHLVDDGKIIRCRTCCSPVTPNMVPNFST